MRVEMFAFASADVRDAHDTVRRPAPRFPSLREGKERELRRARAVKNGAAARPVGQRSPPPFPH